MHAFFDYISQVNQMHWGNSAYQCFFYVASLLILVFDKRKTTKIIFGIYPLMYLVIIYNPLFKRMMDLIWNNNPAYYARMFSFIPLIYCIATGFMQIIIKAKDPMKFILVGCTIAATILLGSNVYKADWMKPIEKLEQVPSEVFRVSEAIREFGEQHPCVAFPYPLNVYMRQIDATLVMPYGRFTNRLGRALQQSVPDVNYIMTEAGKQAVDYVVVHARPEAEDAFSVAGYRPATKTPGYLVYPVKGVPKREIVLNDKQQIQTIADFDENGRIIIDALGYAKYIYEYDDYGNMIKTTFLDENNRKAVLTSGITSVKRSVRYFSHLVDSMIYLDKEDQPMLIDGRYETRYAYNHNKQLIKESYYDQNGMLMNREDVFYALRIIDYDDQGRCVRERYYDKNSKLVNNSFGYAVITMKYNDNNQDILESYYDVNGQQIMINELEEN